jgi:hypothetical protein
MTAPYLASSGGRAFESPIPRDTDAISFLLGDHDGLLLPLTKGSGLEPSAFIT